MNLKFIHNQTSSNETTECFRFLNHITYFKELNFEFLIHHNKIVENKGFEPLTPCVQGRCSSQLS